jgi:peptidoglycan-N-acetylglucosamine deacetylase
VPLTFTYDLEDDGTRAGAAPRYESVTDRLLELLADRNVTATVFVVGGLAERSPALIRAIAAAGHEIALHGHEHVAIDQLGERGFVADVERGKATLEDLTGGAVRGYRAPLFSLTSRTPWAPGRLARLGFAYSSSVLPAPNPIRGYPGAPRGPFRWRAGPLELPCPLLGRSRLTLPFLGGVYLRYLPRWLLRRGARRLGATSSAWIYAHPYDFDDGAPFVVMPHAGWAVSRILHRRRSQTFARVEELLDACGAAPPLGAVAGRLSDVDLPLFGA